MYSADRLSEIANFDAEKFKFFFEVRYKESLKKDYQEEQLYYFYAMKSWGYDVLLKAQSEAVISSHNQILIAYYLKEKWLSNTQVETLKKYDEEELWFQNYHLILYTPDLLADLDDSITKYLIPKNAKKSVQKNSYLDFYKQNLRQSIGMINSVDDILQKMHEYLDIRFKEAYAAYENRKMTRISQAVSNPNVEPAYET